jgi:anti-sigma-K factor RskA
MTHQELGELYDLYALGVLPAEENMEIEAHLARNCSTCESGVKNALELSSLLAAMPEAIEPPRRLRKRVLASVGGQQPVSRTWMGALALLSAGLLIAVAVIGIEERRKAEELADAQDQVRRAEEQVRTSSADLAKLQAALQFLNEPETEQVVFGKGKPQPPRGRVFVNAQRGVLLFASNLSQAPAGKIYEMWLIPKSGAPKPAGLFQSNLQGTALYVLNGPIDRTQTKAVAVTLEPEAGSAAPTSTPIIAAALSN